MDETPKRPWLSTRNRVQWSVFLVTIGVGLQFFLYVHQSLGPAGTHVTRPPGVEGFLPIGALMGWKRFILTGRWDLVHPAAMVIFGFAVLLSFVLRKAFCSWFCPVGTLSEGCWRIGRHLLTKDLRLPPVLDIPLRGVKYILLGFFLWVVVRMSSGQILAFMESPYYRLSDAKMLFFFTEMSLVTAIVLSCLTVLSVLFKNFWCRYLCPYGALLGIFSWMSPTRIERKERHCIHCGGCDSACPSRLTISRNRVVRNPECTGCMDCIAACPEREALFLATPGLSRGFWHPVRAGAFVAVLFVGIVYIANITGHWQGSVSDREFRAGLVTIHSPENTHPRVGF